METSPSGDPIYRHTSPPGDFEPPAMGGESMEAISAHIERHIGPIHMVYHEAISDKVHIDVHHVEPRAGRNFHTLVTSGMSDLPMDAPEGSEDSRYSELMLCLPSEWPMGTENWKDGRFYWPMALLKFLARFPHQYRTWLWSMHTIPNGNPPLPFDDSTKMCGAMLLPPLTTSKEFHQLKIDGEKRFIFMRSSPCMRTSWR